ncbi:MAG: DUF615 domain-containing protein [Gammaproteobacteria bacterium]|nr:DUF615 domain-containing protein [Gammaproteobacteria bacterium]
MSDDLNNQDTPPSKSQLKREAQALTSLGKQLVELDKTMLARLKLGDTVLTAIHDAQKIKQHGALKRQLLYIGKLLRQTDTDDIINQLESFKSIAQQQNRIFHELEQWRDKLLADDQALTNLLDTYPAIDRQHIRQLIRAARKEQSQSKPPTAARNLFKYLRSMILSD